MNCKIDNGKLEHLAQVGYVDTWKCRKCKVVWTLKPEGDIDTDRDVITRLIRQKYKEYEDGRN